MNKFQRKESRELRYLMNNWWMAQGDYYKRFRRKFRKLQRESRGI